jgi:hypothetical protein
LKRLKAAPLAAGRSSIRRSHWQKQLNGQVYQFALLPGFL